MARCDAGSGLHGVLQHELLGGLQALGHDFALTDEQLGH